MSERLFFNNIREAWRILRHKPAPPPTEVVLTCCITPELADDIERMMREAEMESTREFIANAVALWRWAAMRSKDGKVIVALDEKTQQYNEIALPALIRTMDGNPSAADLTLLCDKHRPG